MAKILVADDNSNIQKMVGLALKDQGIDVVAVGNGEAAVRKIPDVKPDLVLADVFMPVRNGYEVCEFVKKDPALAHIPVILLVGAFDPLDEQEAQRVGADGVLKKPFVPPDPLIAMVKAALARAGVSLTANSDKAEKAVKKAADSVPPKPVALPMSVQPPVVAAPQGISIEDTDGLVDDVAVHPAPVSMTGGAPLAFGNLMGTAEVSEEDPGFIAPVHPELAMERDWRATDDDEEVPEEEEEEKPAVSWRRDVDDLSEPSGTGAGAGWRDTTFGEPAVARKNWESPEQQPAMTEAAASTVAATSVLTEAHGQAPGAVAAKPEPESATPAFTADAWNVAIQAGAAETQQSTPTEHGTASTLAVEHDAVTTAIDRFAETKDAAVESSPLATGSWEVQALKATQLAATWDAPADAAVAEAPAAHLEADSATSDAPVAGNEETFTQEQSAEAGVTQTMGAENIVAEPEPAAPERASELEGAALVAGTDASAYAASPEPLAQEHSEPATEVAREHEAEHSSAESLQQEPANIPDSASAAVESEPALASEELVARVLASLSPEVMQRVTQELLKPVVEAMVREELNKKK